VIARGREVTHTGDRIMASFDELAAALECSLAVLAGFETRMTDLGAERGSSFGSRQDVTLKGVGVVPVFESVPAQASDTGGGVSPAR
jgi:hypothetical protein